MFRIWCLINGLWRPVVNDNTLSMLFPSMASAQRFITRLLPEEWLPTILPADAWLDKSPITLVDSLLDQFVAEQMVLREERDRIAVDTSAYPVMVESALQDSYQGSDLLAHVLQYLSDPRQYILDRYVDSNPDRNPFNAEIFAINYVN